MLTSFGVVLLQLFGQMYPNEEFFPKAASPEDPTDEDEDIGLTLEN